MAQSIFPKKKSDAIANGVFLMALGILFYLDAWWPGILLAIWVSLGLRQFLTGRLYDLCISSFILIGLFVISILHLEWAILMPILFIVGGIYIIFREYFFASDTNGEDKVEEIQDDIDIDTRRKKE